MLTGLRQDLPSALAAYARALKVNPQAVHALVKSAFCLKELGRPVESLEHLERALAVTPKDPRLLSYAGDVLNNLKVRGGGDAGARHGTARHGTARRRESRCCGWPCVRPCEGCACSCVCLLSVCLFSWARVGSCVCVDGVLRVRPLGCPVSLASTLVAQQACTGVPSPWTAATQSCFSSW
jgi:hypothetical protein